jgi:hypothetical protein
MREDSFSKGWRTGQRYRYAWAVYWTLVILGLTALLVRPLIAAWLLTCAFVLAWIVVSWPCAVCGRPVGAKRHAGLYYSSIPGVRYCRHCSAKLV